MTSDDVIWLDLTSNNFELQSPKKFWVATRGGKIAVWARSTNFGLSKKQTKTKIWSEFMKTKFIDHQMFLNRLQFNLKVYMHEIDYSWNHKPWFWKNGKFWLARPKNIGLAWDLDQKILIWLDQIFSIIFIGN